MREFLIGFVLVVTAMFLMLIVLLQRGRGGGLAGALGGMGGQSAFGTKAGDLFTKITMVTAAFWILLCIGSLKLLATGSKFTGSDTESKSDSGAEALPPLSGETKSPSEGTPAPVGESKGGGESKSAGAGKSEGPANPPLESSSGSKPAESPASPSAAPTRAENSPAVIGPSGVAPLLLSMTGFGEARRQESGLSVAIELRTINSRYFKLALRTGEGYAALEPQIEATVRNHIKRGTVQVNLRIARPASPDAYRINTDVLTAYWRQLSALPMEWNLPRPSGLEALSVLPGVVSEEVWTADSAEQVWPLVGATLEAALANLARMREEEGRAMATDLRANCRLIGGELEQIGGRAPRMVEDFRSRLAERLRKVLAEHDLALDPADVIREIAIFAERGDISEEIVRLRSHLEQFETIMGLAESSGRKLEFLTQEMHREINTIGSKSTDVEIARHVIEIKAAIERLREMIQNVE